MSDFRLTYDGVALQASTMDVRDLAPALLAAGDLLDAANRVLNGDSQRAQTSVKASFKVGSFGIDFNLATDFAMKVRDLFSSNDAAAITNAIGILGALGFLASNGKKSLIEVMKWIKNRRIIKIESHINGTSATLHVDDEQTEIDIKVLSLLRDLAVREAIDKLLSPLDTEGIDIFATGSDDKIITTIRKEERCWFKTPELADDLVLDDTRKMAFSKQFQSSLIPKMRIYIHRVRACR